MLEDSQWKIMGKVMIRKGIWHSVMLLLETIEVPQKQIS